MNSIKEFISKSKSFETRVTPFSEDVQICKKALLHNRGDVIEYILKINDNNFFSSIIEAIGLELSYLMLLCMKIENPEIFLFEKCKNKIEIKKFLKENNLNKGKNVSR
ncbi:MAG TPA: hypothetical protein VN703_09245 [Candidatus Sulfopaludibacter sp.]|nr:hypothetical protein [Candidatus Sulfopaludibacter sp.]